MFDRSPEFPSYRAFFGSTREVRILVQCIDVHDVVITNMAVASKE
jgi:hypothetical protein